MKQRNYNLSGKTDSNGKFTISDKKAFDDFFRHRPDCNFVGEIVVAGIGSTLLRNYYFYKIVPEIRNALWQGGTTKTKSETDLYLRSICPITIEEVLNIETWKYDQRIREIIELDNHELVHFLDYIKQFAAEELSLYIEDPRVITKK